MEKAELYRIETIAAVFRDAYHIESPVLDFQDIVHRIGGNIFESKSPEPFSDCTVRKNGKKGFTLQVNSTLSDEQKKLALAMALGHLVLNMGFGIDEELWEKQNYDSFALRDMEKDTKENAFALSLLMPKEEFDKVVSEKENDGMVSPDDIAEHFKVPVYAVISRGRALDIFPE